jgi:hypothetical protein
MTLECMATNRDLPRCCSDCDGPGASSGGRVSLLLRGGESFAEFDYVGNSLSYQPDLARDDAYVCRLTSAKGSFSA